MSIRKLPIMGLLAFAAACGGGDQDQQAAGNTETAAPAQSGTPTVEIAPTPAPAQGGAVTPDAGGQVHTVQMVTTSPTAGEFQPATINVKKGDVIRWVMADGQTPHNVSFSQADQNPGGFSAPQDSPIYSQQGQTYELKIDWNPGTYNYVCIPHKMTGMKGSITVS